MSATSGRYGINRDWAAHQFEAVINQEALNRLSEFERLDRTYPAGGQGWIRVSNTQGVLAGVMLAVAGMHSWAVPDMAHPTSGTVVLPVLQAMARSAMPPIAIDWAHTQLVALAQGGADVDALLNEVRPLAVAVVNGDRIEAFESQEEAEAWAVDLVRSLRV